MKYRAVTAQLARIVVLATFGITPIAAAQPSPPRIEYHVSERVRTSTDERIRTTTIGLGTTGDAAYQYREQVVGAITPQVRSVNYRTKHQQRIATAEEKADLIRALLKAKVFDLVSDPAPVQPSDYFGSLNIEINGRKSQVFFNTPPRSRQRTALHEIMQRFARQLGIDKQPANAITITEGDRQPARKVSLAEVLAHPDKYHGKRISVVGFCHTEEEDASLSIDKIASGVRRDYKRSVWRSGLSTFAHKGAFNYKNDTWMRVEGTFLRGRSGHMGMWPGEIARLTRIEPASRPK